MTRRIILLLQGGLGNQLLQIVFASHLARILQSDLIIYDNLLYSTSRRLRGITSRQLSLPVNRCIKQYLKSGFSLKYLSCRFQARARFSSRTTQIINDIDWSHDIIDQVLSNYETLIIKSHCSSAQLFDKRYDQDWLNLYESLARYSSSPIESDEYSATLHIRRGDYQKWPNLYRLLPDEYFYQGASFIMAQTKQQALVFKILTDDHMLVRQIAISNSYQSLRSTIGNSDEIDDFITLCNSDYIVISNSTFSSVAAHISELLGYAKIVVAPREWFPVGHRQSGQQPGKCLGDMRKEGWKLL